MVVHRLTQSTFLRTPHWSYSQFCSIRVFPSCKTLPVRVQLENTPSLHKSIIALGQAKFSLRRDPAHRSYCNINHSQSMDFKFTRPQLNKVLEILLLAQGELNVGFVSTNNTLFATVLKKGQLFVFRKGLVHFQLNLGSGPAMAITAFPAQNVGLQPVAPVLFTLDIKNEVLQKVFKVDQKMVDSIQKQFRK